MNSKIDLTNENLQKMIAEKLLDVSNPDANTQSARTFFNGAKVLLKSVALDIYGAKLMGRPIFKRTKDFLSE